MASRQKVLFRKPRKSRAKEAGLRPATKFCSRCENLLGHSKIENGKRVRLPSTQCEHKGRMYLLNGFIKIRLCVCCISLLRRKSPGTIFREVS